MPACRLFRVITVTMGCQNTIIRLADRPVHCGRRVPKLPPRTYRRHTMVIIFTPCPNTIDKRPTRRRAHNVPGNTVRVAYDYGVMHAPRVCVHTCMCVYVHTYRYDIPPARPFSRPVPTTDNLRLTTVFRTAFRT